MKSDNELAVFQTQNGAIKLQADHQSETIWANLNQIAELFDRDKSVISRHIRNIFESQELSKKGTVAKIATVQKEGGRTIKREIEHFNLDVILSVGYRVDSKNATLFRIWATKTLKEHITKGFTINKDLLRHNQKNFNKAVTSLSQLTIQSDLTSKSDVLELVKAFADTWFSLESFDRGALPATGTTKKKISLEASELYEAVQHLKTELIKSGQASDLFAQEKKKGALEGILGNIEQAFGGKEVYPTIEEKAAHLLYFIVKNHVFTDGNKRTGAFAFIWFLNKAGINFRLEFSSKALTSLTLLVAESKPQDKEQMIGLVLLLLNK